MKAIKVFTVMILLNTGFILNAQQNQFFPAELFTLEGKQIDASSILDNNMPTIMIFWKTTDINGIEDINFALDLWQEQIELKRVKLIFICIDCNGKVQHVKPFVYGHGIEAEVYIDKNGDFKRQMCISDVPNTIVFDQDMNIIYRQNDYCSKNEELLCEKVNLCIQDIVKN